MLKILYYVYAGIRSFRSDLPIISANDSIALAPWSADLIRPPPIGTLPIWLDDVYLNFRRLAPTAVSRFAESEASPTRLDINSRPRHHYIPSTRGPTLFGVSYPIAPGSVFSSFHTPTATAIPRTILHGPTHLPLTTLAIVMPFSFVCPPFHDFWDKDLIVAGRVRSSTSHFHIEPNSFRIFWEHERAKVCTYLYAIMRTCTQLLVSVQKYARTNTSTITHTPIVAVAEAPPRDADD